MKGINANAAALSAAILSAAGMLLIGLLGMAGLYMNGVEAMQAWHIWFEPTLLGIILGMLEAGIFSYVVVYLWVVLYKKLV